MKLIVNDKDISNLYTTIKWSGDEKQITRKVSFSYAYKYKSGLTEFIAKVGDTISLFDDNNKKIYLGIIVSVSNTLAGNMVAVESKDLTMYLDKSKAVGGMYKGTPSEITRKVLNEFNIKVGSLAESSEHKEIAAVGDKTIYSVISESYGDKYYIYADEDKISVALKASDMVFVLSGNANISDANYKSSIENMVNIVKILDDKGSVIGEVKNDNDLKFGIMQEVYKKEKDKDAKKEASLLLKTLENTCSIESAFGDIKCISGKGVYIIDTVSNLMGKFKITDDTHTFERGNHKMSLGLEMIT